MSAPERIYLPTGSIAFHHTRKDGEHTEYVRADLYARLQEQAETLTRERDEAIWAGSAEIDKRAEAEAERDRLREMVLRAADQCDKWVKETYDGGWSTHQVRGQCALAESLRLAALQKEPQPSAQERDDGR